MPGLGGFANLNANYDVALGLEIGLLSCIPVAVFIYVAENDRFAGFRQKLASHRLVRFIEKGMK